MPRLFCLGEIAHWHDFSVLRRFLADIADEWHPHVVIGVVEHLFESEADSTLVLETFFDIGIDVVVTGKAIMGRVASRKCLERDWPLVRPLNLPSFTPGKGALACSVADKPWQMISLDFSAQGQLEDPHQAFETWTQRTGWQGEVLAVLFGENLDEKKAFLWKAQRYPGRITALGAGLGILAAQDLRSKNGLFVPDIGRIEQPWALEGLAPECWWERTQAHRPLKAVLPEGVPDLIGVGIETENGKQICTRRVQKLEDPSRVMGVPR